MSNEVVCNHCGSKVSLEDAHETVWNLENGESLNWHYCDRCEKNVFSGGGKKNENKTLEN